MALGRAAALLAKTELFVDLDEDALNHLGSRATTRTYRRGQRIFTQGDDGDHLFVVIEGLVKILVNSPEGEEVVLATVRPQEAFGELALIDGGARSASADALVNTTTLVLSRQSWLELIRARSEVTEKLLVSLGRMVRRLTEQTTDLVLLDVQTRVAKFVYGLAESRAERKADGWWLHLQLTQSDLASMVGGSRQTVNQALRSLERRGLIELDGRQLIVRDPEGLQRRAGL